MRQIGKLYKYYFRKIWQRNWLRIIFVAIATGVVWFAVPYVFYRFNRKMAGNEIKSMRISALYTDEKVLKPLRNVKFNKIKGNDGFRNFSRSWLGKDTEQFWIAERKVLEDLPARLKELEGEVEKETNQKEREKKENKLENLKTFLGQLEMSDKSIMPMLGLPYNADYSFFFNKNTQQPFWQLLNNISWASLTSFIFLFWLTFNIVDSLFFDSQKEGEEATILTLTPGVQRSDLFFGKVFAFLTFFWLANALFFLVPFGFYYFWTGPAVSWSWFSLLALWTTVIGPTLFFGLLLIPYLFLKSVAEWSGWIISSLLTFGPWIWSLGKMFLFGYATWPYTAERWFFNPFNFMIMALIGGIIFLALYYWIYQEQDLGN